MGDMIQQRLKEQALAEGGEYVGTKDKGGSDKAKYNHAREPWQSPTHAPQKSASQKKQLGRGGAGAEPRRTSTSQQSADNFMADLNKKLGSEDIRRQRQIRQEAPSTPWQTTAPVTRGEPALIIKIILILSATIKLMKPHTQ